MKLLPNIILNFHAIKDPHWFEDILKIIKRFYNPISYEDIENYYLQGKKINHACHITFDDGHISFYKTVFPLLKKYNISASIFVSPRVISERVNFWFQEISDYDFDILNNIIDNRFEFKSFEAIPVKTKLKRLKINEIWNVIYEYQKQTGTQSKSCVNMDLNQIKEVYQSGLVHIGAHTMNHPILKNECVDTVEYEISASITGLSYLLDTPIHSFAYPNGKPGFDFGGREIDILKKNGIKLAFSTIERTLKNDDDLYRIPRSGFEGGSIPYISLKLLSGGNLDVLKKVLNKKNDILYR
jgi:peptidoglycan/xylan/chitin deacetylase (PgdA/CDA1 family)